MMEAIDHWCRQSTNSDHYLFFFLGVNLHILAVQKYCENTVNKLWVLSSVPKPISWPVANSRIIFLIC
jgi:hypothetical protein